MAAAVESRGESFTVAGIRSLFPTALREQVLREPGGYAVGPGGDRFLVNRIVDTGTTSPVVLLVGWPAEMDEER